MEMLLYLALGAVLYGILADRTDRAVDREMRKRRKPSDGPHLVEDFDAGPALRPWNDWFLRRVRRLPERMRVARPPR